MRRPWVWLVAFLASGALAGCILPGPEPDRPPGPVEAYTPRPVAQAVAECTEAAPAWVHLEKHTDHSGGDSIYWTFFPDGTAILARGHPRVAGNGTQVLGAYHGQDEVPPDALCAALAGFSRPSPWREGTMNVTLLVRIAVERSFDPAVLEEVLDPFWDLPENSSVTCMSGADSWMQAQWEDRVHAVHARCAPKAPFAEVQEALQDVVGEEFFSYW